jgi:hypothetical protein
LPEDLCPAQSENFCHPYFSFSVGKALRRAEGDILAYYLTPAARRKPRPTAKIFVTGINPQAKCQGSQHSRNAFALFQIIDV